MGLRTKKTRFLLAKHETLFFLASSLNSKAGKAEAQTFLKLNLVSGDIWDQELKGRKEDKIIKFILEVSQYFDLAGVS